MDSVLSQPNYRYWSSHTYVEYSYFAPYLFERSNHAEATDLKAYVKNVADKYKARGTAFLRIAVSRALASFADHANRNALQAETTVVLESVCRR